MKTMGAKPFSKTMGAIMFLNLKMMGAKILKCRFKWFLPTQFLPTRKTSKKICMVRLNFNKEKIYLRWTQESTQILIIIYVLVQFLQQHTLLNFIWQHLWYIITCNWYVHNIRYMYHIDNKWPSITTKFPIIANGHHNYRKCYAVQQPTQTDAIRTKWTWFINSS